MDWTKYFTIFLPSLIKNDKLAENIRVWNIFQRMMKMR